VASGGVVDGTVVRPVAAGVFRDSGSPGAAAKLRVIVSEGRNREVRKLCENAGLDVKTLRRVRVGGLKLPRSLGPGQYKRLYPNEVRRVSNIGEQTKLHAALGLVE